MSLNSLNPPKPVSKLILLGEDDMDDQEFLENILYSVDNSYKLAAIGNGKKIVAFLEDLPIDSLPSLIVLDYNLPELNGEEVLKILGATERYYAIPKLIWSTSNSAFYKAKCREMGALDYIVKPSNVTSFTETVKYMLSFISS